MGSTPPTPASLVLSRVLTGLKETDLIGTAWQLGDIETRVLGAPQPVLRGNYRLLAPIGAGGFGTVYAAQDPRLERKVAIKLLHAEHEAARPDLLLNEAQAMARLSHPNVVTVHDVGTYTLETGEVGGLFVVMEFIEGETLLDWLAAARRPWPVVVEHFLAAGRGLSAAHEIGLIHRDFKPGNVLLGRDGSIRVADFGLALRPGEVPDTSPAGSRPGTPLYMAPEMFDDSATPGPPADQFSFCVALFEALHGVQPFPTTGLPERLQAIRGSAVAPVVDKGEVPGWLHEAVVRGLHPDPTRRHPDMAELLRALDPMATPRGVGDIPAIRSRIQMIEPGIVRYHEIRLITEFSVYVMRDELTRLTADGRPYTMAVDLEEAGMPGTEVLRHAIGAVFIDPHLVYVAVMTGGDPVKNLAATLVAGRVLPRERFGLYDNFPAAVAACRDALTRVASAG